MSKFLDLGFFTVNAEELAEVELVSRDDNKIRLTFVDGGDVVFKVPSLKAALELFHNLKGLYTGLIYELDNSHFIRKDCITYVRKYTEDDGRTPHYGVSVVATPGRTIQDVSYSTKEEQEEAYNEITGNL